jgi:hypothetical protein
VALISGVVVSTALTLVVIPLLYYMYVSTVGEGRDHGRCPASNPDGKEDHERQRALRAIAGAFVVLSVALGYFVHPGFFLFTAFVGLNLFQSAFTRWCPMMTFLRMAGVRD